MVLRCVIVIALATCLFVLNCDACDTEKCSTEEATASSEKHSGMAANSKSKVKPPKKKKGMRCPKNEEFSICTQSISRAQYCSQKGQSLCSHDYTKCTKGCVCKKHYLRSNNGTCIPERTCDTNCGQNEVLEECPVDCADDYCPTKDGEAGACFKPDQDQCPAPVCKCSFNYRRAKNGTCISTRDCPPFDCSARPNEEFNACPPLCPTDDCSQATPSGKCPQFGNILITLPCNPQCRCIRGYWRKDGICVPYEECPNICPLNEEYNSCTQAICRHQNCSTRDDPVSCPEVHPAFCKTGCVCKENYYRNENGTCVPEEQCNVEPKPTCEDNEVLVDCPSDCKSDHCPKCEEDNKKCEQPNPCPPPACKCRFNHRRAPNGTCIPTGDCPPFDCSAKPNEQYALCPPICPSDSCGWPRIRGKCPFRIGILLHCNPKCQCKDGFGRLKNGTCVPFDECPDICPVNEEYNSCTQATCRQQNCSTKNDPVGCPKLKPAFCKAGCVCKENHYRNENGTCVPEEQCNENPKPTCDDKEILVDCPSDCESDHCPKCEEDNKRCKQPNPCPPPACKCRFNYRRAQNGTCIPTVDCPPFDCSAKPNEEYAPCPPICPSDSCSLPRIRGKCPFRIGIVLECKPRCQCKDGYGRLENGTCVTFDECPNLCPTNEEYNSCTQAVCRPQNCTNKFDLVHCSMVEVSSCKKGCVCKENYYRNDKGVCVEDEKCPVPLCPNPNEEYKKSLVTNCPLLGTCTSIVARIRCDKPEVASCVCKGGYLRLNETSSCIPTCECPQMKNAPQCQTGSNICPLNEECNSCTEAICRHQNCSTRDDPVSCPEVDPAFCTTGCVCKENYYRNKNGICVPEEQCNDEPKPTCEDNEVLVDCPSDCESDHCPKCEEDNKKCERPNPCPPPACKCRFNHRRAPNGTCIPTVDCPPFDCSSKPNEQYTPCPPICPSDSCGLPRIRGKCPFRIGTVLECKPKCQCKDGYGRLENGTCVTFDECPNICLTNEEYNSCTQAVCRPQNCTNKFDIVLRPMVEESSCKKGCVCKENYYRNDKGVCVEYEKCPVPLCPNPNEEYKKSLVTNCPLLGTCKSIIARIICDKPEEASCVCKDGYLRLNETSSCIPTCECPEIKNAPQCQTGPNICPLNEEYNSCTQAICRHQNCSTRDDPVSCPEVDPAFCTTGCVCKENYYRNKNGTCVPEEQCNDEPKPTCEDNEVLVDCPSDCESDHCPKCKEDNKRCERPNPCPPPACKCRFNHRRAPNGTCIPTVDCPPFDCRSKPNEQYTPCPPICPSDSCGLPRIRGKCPFRIGTVLECKPKCQCKDGYGRLENGTCVTFDECPNICLKNEEYNSCTQAVCRPQNCTNKFDIVHCPMVEESSCKKGCVCKENYYRNDKGVCVEDEKCPVPLCPNPNEEYKKSLVTNCPLLGTCKSIIARIICDKPEEASCVCKDGYLRLNETSSCIPTCECPEIKNAPQCQTGPNICPLNEEYNSCTQAICRHQNCSTRDDPVSCPEVDPAFCTTGCVCKENYYRNKNGTCVPEEQCNDEPKPTCEDNEVLVDCPSDCESDHCPKCEEDNKKCERPNPCPPPACKCRFNHRRAPNGTCIPTVDCPPFDCSSKPNEQYTPCPPICPSDRCGLPRIRGKCPFRIGTVLECKPKCQCKDGYGRLENGTCVTFDECLPLCPNPNEEYKKSLVTNCPLLGTCTSIVARIRCDKPEVASCVCKDGYLRLNETSSYIPTCECPQMKNASECQTGCT